MTTLLVIHDNYQEDNYFPLGPAYLAACLRDNGHDVDVYCMDVYHYTNDELAEYLDTHDYGLIGFGFLASRFKETIVDLSKVINEHKKNAIFVIGGHGPSPIPRYMLKNTNADIAIIGEAEETIVDIADGKELPKIRSIAYRDGADIKVNEKREPIRNLDSIPFPAWDLFPIDKYINSVKWSGWKEGDRSFYIITSRGCVNACTFCYRMEKGIRLRSIDKVMDEIKILHKKYGINYFLIQDECFVVSEKRIKEFTDALKELDFNIKYYCDCRVERFNEDIARMLKESGCTFVNFGFEANTQRLLELMKKNTTVELNERAAKIAKKFNLGLGLNFIWNFPTDTYEDLKRRTEFIKKYNQYDQIRTIKPVTPYPGCELYYYAISKGLLEGPEDFFDRFKNLDLLTINFTGIPEEEAYKMLYESNEELILDYFEHTKGDIEEGKALLEQFRKLYFEGFTKFRGARHYD